jgi:hypothetical protein
VQFVPGHDQESCNFLAKEGHINDNILTSLFAVMTVDRKIVRRTNGHSVPNLSLTAEVALEAFCRDLLATDLQNVKNAVREITGFQRQIITNMLAIGDQLNKLRSQLHPEIFCRFMTEMLPALGISRSTGYRWLSHADKLGAVFPNPVVRQYLTALTDGRGIIAHGHKHGKPDYAQITLTPAAEMAIRTTAPAPESATDRSECEQWVRQFVKAMGKARSRVRSRGSGFNKERDDLIERFDRFASRYGLALAEDLCGCMDKILNERAEEQKGINSVPTTKR